VHRKNQQALPLKSSGRSSGRRSFHCTLAWRNRRAQVFLRILANFDLDRSLDPRQSVHLKQLVMPPLLQCRIRRDGATEQIVRK
jgi:hypothetical protein